MYNTNRKINLLKDYYYSNCFVLYAGAIFNFNTNTNKPSVYEKNSKKDSKSKPKPNFCLDTELENHVLGKINLGGILNSTYSQSLLAWDLDADQTEQKELVESVKIFISFLQQQGLTPFVYLSGGKGYHIEVKLNQPCSYDFLHNVANLIKDQVKQRNVKFIDRTYPCGSRYRLFGCYHYKTKNFTYAVKLSDLSPFSEEDSWKQFEQYLQTYPFVNSLKTLQWLVKNYSPTPSINNAKTTQPISVTKCEELDLPLSSTQEATEKIEDLMQLYQHGLSKEYRERTGNGRYLTAYQLGRLFRFVFNYDESQAEIAIDSWLRRHYQNLCSSEDFWGLEAQSCIKTPYEACRQETILNCKNAYLSSAKPFKIQKYNINMQKTRRILAKKNISSKEIKLLAYLMRQCNKYSSLSIFQSYPQLMDGWKIGSSRTVKKYLDLLYRANFIIRLKQGNYLTHETSLYLITIPPECYTVI